uniref:Uncharacterized protein n=1 Tax=Physcomitrium patens TaxID=3218 RepID=A0A2K1LBV3_PHYPA|nr:hypothetical protein PHYPA_001940 [Physcomitrium patens]
MDGWSEKGDVTSRTLRDCKRALERGVAPYNGGSSLCTSDGRSDILVTCSDVEQAD